MRRDQQEFCTSAEEAGEVGSMNIQRPILVALAVLLACTTQIADGKTKHPAEQTSFSAEDTSVKKPAVIPQDVLAALSRDELVRNVLENEDIPAEKIPASWFSASAIHLGNAREVDLIVMSVGPVHGANVTMFWIFRPTAYGQELIFTGGGHDLRVKSTRWNGYRDIETLAVTMQKVSTVFYRFDGKKYTGYKDKLEEIR
jgi:hypothetical protein